MKLIKMKHLIIGNGQVGKALYEVISPSYSTDIIDIKDVNSSKYDVIHIAFPYSESFLENVDYYKVIYLKQDGLCIIHSTVPIGTNTKLGSISSPIRGKHPELAQGIKTFVKYFGGNRSDEAAILFSNLGIRTHYIKNPEDCEAGKLFDTAQLGYLVILNKMVKRYCDEHSLDFNFVYKDWNKTYNDGYRSLGFTHVMRPYLDYVEGEIGGHCVTSNLNLMDSELTEFIKLENEKLKGVANGLPI